MKVWSTYSPTSFSQYTWENILSLKSVLSLHAMDMVEESKMDLNVLFGMCRDGLPNQYTEFLLGVCQTSFAWSYGLHRPS